MAPELDLLARLCLSGVFLFSGLAKLRHPAAGMAEVAELGLPAPRLCLILMIACQLVAGAMLLLGLWAWLGALALLGFTVVATLLGHQFWRHRGAVRRRTLTTALEHLAIVGGLLLILVHGTGPFSLDRLLP